MSEKRILVVEDEAIVAMDIQVNLENLGYIVPVMVSSGEEALKKAEEFRPDLVLMDIMLKGDMDGIDAADRIRSDLDIPVVYLTAYADDDTLSRAKITEPFGYIVKPFTERELHSTIEMAIYRHRAETELKKTKEWLATVLRSIGDAVITTDSNGLVTSMNPVAEALTGWKEDEAKGKRMTEVFHIINEQTRKRVENPVEKVLRNGVVVGLANHTVLIDRQGTEHFIDDSAAPIKNDMGEIQGVVLIFRDITEKRKMLAQAQQAQKMEAIGVLAGGIAHDFNNLLMGIQGNASLMMLGMDPGHAHYRRLKDIEQFVQRGANLTRQLLGFARGGKYQVAQVNINELIEENSSLFGRTKKEITIYTKYYDGLWKVDGDRGQLDQALLNLYVNAWQAMPEGGSIYIHTENVDIDDSFVRPYKVEPGRYVKISVADNGVGMDEKTKRRIFEPFFTTKEMGTGTGLGLSAVYGIIKNHGGFIDVLSSKGEGATFEIYLPASKGKGDGDKKTKLIDDDIPIGTETILFVDDEEMVMNVGAEILERLGYTVQTAGSGKEAIRICTENRGKFDLVILDMIMPGMGGRIVYEKIKEADPDVKILLSSGYSIDTHALELLKKGCSGFIQKPFGLKSLSQKVREVLDGR